ncbi:hypothetical protein C6499_14610 [Candidatus Poribacteria bacterium]|nr:MAG: hypothetical protein C6499_14610 [Candidatus Poribacteria bacterium]
MWMLKLVIKPTSGLTFRRMPSSILHISTYPFLPPTTMSGFLRRLKMLETGHLPETAVKDPDYYALPPQLCTLGAYPKENQHRIHTTKRQGIRSFKHNAFSRIVRHQSRTEVYQLHTWEYLFAEQLIGYVVAEDEKLLRELKTVKNFGCKIGKEGYAFVDQICGPTQLTLEQVKARPDTLLPGVALIGVPCEAFPLYRYAWGIGASEHTNLAHPQPSSIEGFIPFVAGEVHGAIELDYYTDGNIHLPKPFIDELWEGESDG